MKTRIIATMCMAIVFTGCATHSENKEVEKFNADTAAISRQPKDTVSPEKGALSGPDTGKPYGPNYKELEKKPSEQNNTVQDKYPSKDGK